MSVPVSVRLHVTADGGNGETDLEGSCDDHHEGLTERKAVNVIL